MQPIVTDRVAWSVGLSICLLVCHTSEPCRNGWTDWDVWVMDSGGPKETYIMRRSRGAIFRGKNMPWLARRHSAVSCAKMAEPIQMPFGSCSRGGPKEVCVAWGHIGATWRIRLNRPYAAAMRPYVKLLWPLVCKLVLALDSWNRGAMSPSIRSVVVDEERMRSGHWLGGLA